MYFSYKGHELTLKNSLQKEIMELIKDNDRMVIQDHHVGEFRNEIITAIEELNKKHSRCKPEQVYWDDENFFNDGDIVLRGIYGINFHLYKSKN